jgi:hypothetical protein
MLRARPKRAGFLAEGAIAQSVRRGQILKLPLLKASDQLALQAGIRSVLAAHFVIYVSHEP